MAEEKGCMHGYIAHTCSRCSEDQIAKNKIAAAYRAGQGAMRERAAQKASRHGCLGCEILAREIRALSLEETK